MTESAYERLVRRLDQAVGSAESYAQIVTGLDAIFESPDLLPAYIEKHGVEKLIGELVERGKLRRGTAYDWTKDMDFDWFQILYALTYKTEQENVPLRSAQGGYARREDGGLTCQR